jgi:hypothetical protein
MTTILFAFLTSFLLSLALTPGAQWLGLRFDVVDMPGKRKVHTWAIPRSGSASIGKAKNIGQSELVERRKNSQGRESVTNPFQFKMDTGEAGVRIWTRGYFRRESDTSTRQFLKMEIPLGSNGDLRPPRLVLFKDIKRNPLQRYTMQRVENLRRAMTSVLERLHEH